MELVKWGKEAGYTLFVAEEERLDLIQLLKGKKPQILMEGDTYELEILRKGIHKACR